jgi:protein-S-isoprenylcysteine O-methyltransferase Ste14
VCGDHLWRIHIEEAALMTASPDRYGAYAAHIPMIW